MSYDALCNEATERHLSVLGGFHPDARDADIPGGTRTVLMLGPKEPDFWPAVQNSPEWRDGLPDPLDRWSARVIGGWAGQLGAVAAFPFGGPPYRPFFTWALRTGRTHVSPIRLLVHDSAGLLVSFRGALLLKERVDLPPPPDAPCKTCAGKPCRTACPVQAFASGEYDVPRCKDYLDTAEGQDCMTQGCAARRACPVSQQFPRLPEQSAYHMRAFKG